MMICAHLTIQQFTLKLLRGEGGGHAQLGPKNIKFAIQGQTKQMDFDPAHCGFWATPFFAYREFNQKS